MKELRETLNVAAVCALFLYLTALAALHIVAVFRAAEVAQVAVAANEQVLEVNALPIEANPLKWRAVIVTESAFHVCDVAISESGNEGNPQLTRYPRLTGDEASLEAAATKEDVKKFLRFARFPVTKVHETEVGRDVEIEDIRFAGLTNAFRVRVKLDRELKPINVL